MSNTKMSKEEVQEAIGTIYTSMCEGKLDVDIMAEMGLDLEDYKKLRSAMLDAKADEVRAKPTEHVYVEYMILQARNIGDLTKMIEEFINTKQYTALVGAIRTRAELYDKLITRGQEFGLIHKEPDRKQIVAGVLVADLTNRQLKGAITTELATLNTMMSKYGEGNILEMAPGTLHHGPRLPPSSDEDSAVVGTTPKRLPSKTAKAKNVKRHAGRPKARARLKVR